MSRRAFQVLLLVLLAALVTDEVHGIYLFKRAPNQFRKRAVQTPLMIFAWVRKTSFVVENIYLITVLTNSYYIRRTKSKQAMPVKDYVLLVFVKTTNRHHSIKKSGIKDMTDD